MRTPCPFCGAIVGVCDCEYNYVRDEIEDIVTILRNMDYTVVPPRQCGGCQGKGAHSRRCTTQPGWYWRQLEDKAEHLGDSIGANDTVAANMAYTIAARMRAKAEGEGA